MNKVVYLSYYSLQSIYRTVSPAAVAMTKYVSKALTQAVGKITIISPAQASDRKFYPQEETVMSKIIKLYFFRRIMQSLRIILCAYSIDLVVKGT